MPQLLDPGCAYNVEKSSQNKISKVSYNCSREITMQMTILSYVELYIQYSITSIIIPYSYGIISNLYTNNNIKWLHIFETGDTYIYTHEDIFVGDFCVDEQLVFWPK